MRNTLQKPVKVYKRDRSTYGIGAFKQTNHWVIYKIIFLYLHQKTNLKFLKFIYFLVNHLNMSPKTRHLVFIYSYSGSIYYKKLRKFFKKSFFNTNHIKKKLFYSHNQKNSKKIFFFKDKFKLKSYNF